MNDWSPEAPEGKCDERGIKCTCKGPRILSMHGMC